MPIWFYIAAIMEPENPNLSKIIEGLEKRTDWLWSAEKDVKQANILARLYLPVLLQKVEVVF